MKKWSTYVWAKQPNGECLLFEGKPVTALTKGDARRILDSKSMGYLSVGDEFLGYQSAYLRLKQLN